MKKDSKNFNAFPWRFISFWPAILFFFVISCEAQVQKNNFRTAEAASGTPSASASETQDGGSTASPSVSENQSSNSSTPLSMGSPSSTPSASINASPSASTSTMPSPSVSASPGSIDAKAPVPGGDGLIEASNISSSSLELSWTTGTDNKTSSSQIQYLVFMSTSNNLSTVASTEANGTAIGFYIPDLSGKIVSELGSSTTYFFTVIVKDLAGNKAVYTATSATTLDATPPVVGNSGTITSSNIAANSFSIAWTAATDNISNPSELEYLVYRSTVSNLANVSDTEINGTAVGTYSHNITSKSITGLISSRLYYINIIVKDAAGNKSAYGMQSVGTLDNLAPAVGNSGVITASAITPTSITLSWMKATDTITTQANLQYIVYQSTTNNIPSLAGAEANGIAIGSNTADINSKIVTGLTPNTTYYFNVIVRDAASNKASYAMLATATLPLPPSLPTRSEAYAKINTAFTYTVTASNGSLPLLYSLSAAPSGATIDTSTAVISYTAGGSLGDLSFSVLVTDAIGRTATQNFILHVGSYKVCVWTGAGDTTFPTPANWIFCGGTYPGSTDYVVIDAAGVNQPTITATTTFQGFGKASSGSGGTITIGAGADLLTRDYLGSFQSDVILKGASPTCTTCRLTTYGNYGYSITNDATLKIGSGITVLYSGTNTVIRVGYVTSGHLIIDPESNSPAEWPLFDADASGGSGYWTGLQLTGVSPQNPSSILVNGMNIRASKRIISGLEINNNVTIKKLKNINFDVTALNAMYTANTYISFASCTGISIEDLNWSGLIFSQGVRNWFQWNHHDSYAVNVGTCTSIGPITISGSGRGFRIEYDPNNVLNWTNDTSQTCTWTGAVDTNWTTPANWSNCTNNRGNFPDHLDSVIIPVTANQPAITGNQAIKNTAAGTGGGTITVNPNSSLYLNNVITEDSFSSSVKFAGGTAGCTTCIVQPRTLVTLNDGVSLTLLPNIRFYMYQFGFVVGESTSRNGRAANFIVAGGATPANYPVITMDPNLTGGWNGIIVDGKAGTNSTVSIDGLIIGGLGGNEGLYLADRFTVSKLDHLSVDSALTSTTSGSAVHIANCANSTLVPTWTDLTIVSDPSPGYSVHMSDPSCSAINPITISGQGDGYGSNKANDPDGRFSW